MPRILIVDDEGPIRSLLARAFARAGYEVRTAADGAQAIVLAGSEPFDVLLSDVMMPSMNGHDVVRWVIKRHPAIRCVLMTAFDGVDCQDCPFFSRCKVLPKPFSLKDAVCLLDQVLKEPSN